MAQNVIAIICDCDGTLCPDTTDRLVSELGLDLGVFWGEVSRLVENGWDPPLAYLNRLLDLARSGEIEPLTREKFRALGSTIQFYPGALDFIDRLRIRLSEYVEYRDAGITLEWYVVSSGIEDLLKETPLDNRATEIYGCAVEYDAAGRSVAVKRAVTFTEKTKFVFAINKGISGEGNPQSTLQGERCSK